MTRLNKISITLVFAYATQISMFLAIIEKDKIEKINVIKETADEG